MVMANTSGVIIGGSTGTTHSGGNLPSAPTGIMTLKEEGIDLEIKAEGDNIVISVTISDTDKLSAARSMLNDYFDMRILDGIN
jgi:hypothetical protein